MICTRQKEPRYDEHFSSMRKTEKRSASNLYHLMNNSGPCVTLEHIEMESWIPSPPQIPIHTSGSLSSESEFSMARFKGSQVVVEVSATKPEPQIGLTSLVQKSEVPPSHYEAKISNVSKGISKRQALKEATHNEFFQSKVVHRSPSAPTLLKQNSENSVCQELKAMTPVSEWRSLSGSRVNLEPESVSLATMDSCDRVLPPVESTGMEAEKEQRYSHACVEHTEMGSRPLSPMPQQRSQSLVSLRDKCLVSARVNSASSSMYGMQLSEMESEPPFPSLKGRPRTRIVPNDGYASVKAELVHSSLKDAQASCSAYSQSKSPSLSTEELSTSLRTQTAGNREGYSQVSLRLSELDIESFSPSPKKRSDDSRSLTGVEGSVDQGDTSVVTSYPKNPAESQNPVFPEVSRDLRTVSSRSLPAFQVPNTTFEKSKEQPIKQTTGQQISEAKPSAFIVEEQCFADGVRKTPSSLVDISEGACHKEILSRERTGTPVLVSSSDNSLKSSSNEDVPLRCYKTALVGSSSFQIMSQFSRSRSPDKESNSSLEDNDFSAESLKQASVVLSSQFQPSTSHLQDDSRPLTGFERSVDQDDRSVVASYQKKLVESQAPVFPKVRRELRAVTFKPLAALQDPDTTFENSKEQPIKKTTGQQIDEAKSSAFIVGEQCFADGVRKPPSSLVDISEGAGHQQILSTELTGRPVLVSSSDNSFKSSSNEDVPLRCYKTALVGSSSFQMMSQFSRSRSPDKGSNSSLKDDVSSASKSNLREGELFPTLETRELDELESPSPSEEERSEFSLHLFEDRPLPEGEKSMPNLLKRSQTTSLVDLISKAAPLLRAEVSQTLSSQVDPVVSRAVMEQSCSQAALEHRELGSESRPPFSKQRSDSLSSFEDRLLSKGVKSARTLPDRSQEISGSSMKLELLKLEAESRATFSKQISDSLYLLKDQPPPERVKSAPTLSERSKSAPLLTEEFSESLQSQVRSAGVLSERGYSYSQSSLGLDGLESESLSQLTMQRSQSSSSSLYDEQSQARPKSAPSSLRKPEISVSVGSALQSSLCLAEKQSQNLLPPSEPRTSILEKERKSSECGEDLGESSSSSSKDRSDSLSSVEHRFLPEKAKVSPESSIGSLAQAGLTLSILAPLLTMAPSERLLPRSQPARTPTEGEQKYSQDSLVLGKVESEVLSPEKQVSELSQPLIEGRLSPAGEKSATSSLTEAQLNVYDEGIVAETLITPSESSELIGGRFEDKEPVSRSTSISLSSNVIASIGNLDLGGVQSDTPSRLESLKEAPVGTSSQFRSSTCHLRDERRSLPCYKGSMDQGDMSVAPSYQKDLVESQNPVFPEVGHGLSVTTFENSSEQPIKQTTGQQMKLESKSPSSSKEERSESLYLFEDRLLLEGATRQDSEDSLILGGVETESPSSGKQVFGSSLSFHDGRMSSVIAKSKPSSLTDLQVKIDDGGKITETMTLPSGFVEQISGRFESGKHVSRPFGKSASSDVKIPAGNLDLCSLQSDAQFEYSIHASVGTVSKLMLTTLHLEGESGSAQDSLGRVNLSEMAKTLDTSYPNDVLESEKQVFSGVSLDPRTVTPISLPALKFPNKSSSETEIKQSVGKRIRQVKSCPCIVEDYARETLSRMIEVREDQNHEELPATENSVIAVNGPSVDDSFTSCLNEDVPLSSYKTALSGPSSFQIPHQFCHIETSDKESTSSFEDNEFSSASEGDLRDNQSCPILTTGDKIQLEKFPDVLKSAEPSYHQKTVDSHQTVVLPTFTLEKTEDLSKLPLAETPRPSLSAPQRDDSERPPPRSPAEDSSSNEEVTLSSYITVLLGPSSVQVPGQFFQIESSEKESSSSSSSSAGEDNLRDNESCPMLETQMMSQFSRSRSPDKESNSSLEDDVSSASKSNLREGELFPTLETREVDELESPSPSEEERSEFSLHLFEDRPLPEGEKSMPNLLKRSQTTSLVDLISKAAPLLRAEVSQTLSSQVDPVVSRAVMEQSCSQAALEHRELGSESRPPFSKQRSDSLSSFEDRLLSKGVKSARTLPDRSQEISGSSMKLELLKLEAESRATFSKQISDSLYLLKDQPPPERVKSAPTLSERSKSAPLLTEEFSESLQSQVRSAGVLSERGYSYSQSSLGLDGLESESLSQLTMQRSQSSSSSLYDEQSQARPKSAPSSLRKPEISVSVGSALQSSLCLAEKQSQNLLPPSEPRTSILEKERKSSECGEDLGESSSSSSKDRSDSLSSVEHRFLPEKAKVSPESSIGSLAQAGLTLSILAPLLTMAPSERLLPRSQPARTPTEGEQKYSQDSLVLGKVESEVLSPEKQVSELSQPLIEGRLSPAGEKSATSSLTEAQLNVYDEGIVAETLITPSESSELIGGRFEDKEPVSRSTSISLSSNVIASIGNLDLGGVQSDTPSRLESLKEVPVGTSSQFRSSTCHLRDERRSLPCYKGSMDQVDMSVAPSYQKDLVESQNPVFPEVGHGLSVTTFENSSEQPIKQTTGQQMKLESKSPSSSKEERSESLYLFEDRLLLEGATRQDSEDSLILGGVETESPSSGKQVFGSSLSFHDGRMSSVIAKSKPSSLTDLQVKIDDGGKITETMTLPSGFVEQISGRFESGKHVSRPFGKSASSDVKIPAGNLDLCSLQSDAQFEYSIHASVGTVSKLMLTTLHLEGESGSAQDSLGRVNLSEMAKTLDTSYPNDVLESEKQVFSGVSLDPRTVTPISLPALKFPNKSSSETEIKQSVGKRIRQVKSCPCIVEDYARETLSRMIEVREDQNHEELPATENSVIAVNGPSVDDSFTSCLNEDVPLSSYKTALSGPSSFQIPHQFCHIETSDKESTSSFEDNEFSSASEGDLRDNQSCPILTTEDKIQLEKFPDVLKSAEPSYHQKTVDSHQTVVLPTFTLEKTEDLSKLPLAETPRPSLSAPQRDDSERPPPRSPAEDSSSNEEVTLSSYITVLLGPSSVQVPGQFFQIESSEKESSSSSSSSAGEDNLRDNESCPMLETQMMSQFSRSRSPDKESNSSLEDDVSSASKSNLREGELFPTLETREVDELESPSPSEEERSEFSLHLFEDRPLPEGEKSMPNLLKRSQTTSLVDLISKAAPLLRAEVSQTLSSQVDPVVSRAVMEQSCSQAALEHRELGSESRPPFSKQRSDSLSSFEDRLLSKGVKSARTLPDRSQEISGSSMKLELLKLEAESRATFSKQISDSLYLLKDQPPPERVKSAPTLSERSKSAPLLTEEFSESLQSQVRSAGVLSERGYSYSQSSLGLDGLESESLSQLTMQRSQSSSSSLYDEQSQARPKSAPSSLRKPEISVSVGSALQSSLCLAEKQSQNLLPPSEPRTSILEKERKSSECGEDLGESSSSSSKDRSDSLSSVEHRFLPEKAKVSPESSIGSLAQAGLTLSILAPLLTMAPSERLLPRSQPARTPTEGEQKYSQDSLVLGKVESEVLSPEKQVSELSQPLIEGRLSPAGEKSATSSLTEAQLNVYDEGIVAETLITPSESSELIGGRFEDKEPVSRSTSISLSSNVIASIGNLDLGGVQSDTPSRLESLKEVPVGTSSQFRSSTCHLRDERRSLPCYKGSMDQVDMSVAPSYQKDLVESQNPVFPEVGHGLSVTTFENSSEQPIKQTTGQQMKLESKSPSSSKEERSESLYLFEDRLLLEGATRQDSEDSLILGGVETESPSSGKQVFGSSLSFHDGRMSSVIAKSKPSSLTDLQVKIDDGGKITETMTLPSGFVEQISGRFESGKHVSRPFGKSASSDVKIPAGNLDLCSLQSDAQFEYSIHASVGTVSKLMLTTLHLEGESGSAQDSLGRVNLSEMAKTLDTSYPNDVLESEKQVFSGVSLDPRTVTSISLPALKFPNKSSSETEIKQSVGKRIRQVKSCPCIVEDYARETLSRMIEVREDQNHEELPATENSVIAVNGPSVDDSFTSCLNEDVPLSSYKTALSGPSSFQIPHQFCHIETSDKESTSSFEDNEFSSASEGDLRDNQSCPILTTEDKIQLEKFPDVLKSAEPSYHQKTVDSHQTVVLPTFTLEKTEDLSKLPLAETPRPSLSAPQRDDSERPPPRSPAEDSSLNEEVTLSSYITVLLGPSSVQVPSQFFQIESSEKESSSSSSSSAGEDNLRDNESCPMLETLEKLHVERSHEVLKGAGRLDYHKTLVSHQSLVLPTLTVEQTEDILRLTVADTARPSSVPRKNDPEKALSESSSDNSFTLSSSEDIPIRSYRTALGDPLSFQIPSQFFQIESLDKESSCSSEDDEFFPASEPHLSPNAKDSLSIINEISQGNRECTLNLQDISRGPSSETSFSPVFVENRESAGQEPPCSLLDAATTQRIKEMINTIVNHARGALQYQLKEDSSLDQSMKSNCESLLLATKSSRSPIIEESASCTVESLPGDLECLLQLEEISSRTDHPDTWKESEVEISPAAPENINVGEDTEKLQGAGSSAASHNCPSEKESHDDLSNISTVFRAQED